MATRRPNVKASPQAPAVRQGVVSEAKQLASYKIYSSLRSFMKRRLQHALSEWRVRCSVSSAQPGAPTQSSVPRRSGKVRPPRSNHRVPQAYRTLGSPLNSPPLAATPAPPAAPPPLDRAATFDFAASSSMHHPRHQHHRAHHGRRPQQQQQHERVSRVHRRGGGSDNSGGGSQQFTDLPSSLLAAANVGAHTLGSPLPGLKASSENSGLNSSAIVHGASATDDDIHRHPAFRPRIPLARSPSVGISPSLRFLNTPSSKGMVIKTPLRHHSACICWYRYVLPS